MNSQIVTSGCGLQLNGNLFHKKMALYKYHPFFMSNNSQLNLYIYNLGTPYNYCKTGMNLNKHDIAAESLQT